MSTGDKRFTAKDQIQQITTTMQTVTEALRAAAEKAAASNQEIAQVALKQAQDNVAQMMETVSALAANQNPSEIAAAYGRFVTESAQKHGQQLMEISQMMARGSKETWQPVVEAIMAASKRP